MADELNPKAVALALAAISGVAYVLCAVLFAVAPQLILGLYSDMFHGVDIAKIARTSVPLWSIVAGFVESIVLSLVFGWLFAMVYNYFRARQRI